MFVGRFFSVEAVRAVLEQALDTLPQSRMLRKIGIRVQEQELSLLGTLEHLCVAAEVCHVHSRKTARLSYITLVNGAAPKYDFTSDSQLVQYWIRPDGLIVTGITTRQLPLLTTGNCLEIAAGMKM